MPVYYMSCVWQLLNKRIYDDDDDDDGPHASLRIGGFGEDAPYKLTFYSALRYVTKILRYYLPPG